ncbi:ankyrin repeat-containing domain protein, partial [Pavlovales sp. CCMP2436]
AAFLGDSELLSRCLHEEPDCVTRASPDGWLPLHYAAEHGHTVCAEMLLASEANVDARGRDGWTALMWAGRRGHEGMVDLLLDAGADTSLAHVKGWYALH